MKQQKSTAIVSGHILNEVYENTTTNNNKVISFTIFQLHDIPGSDKKKPTYIKCNLWNSQYTIADIKPGFFIEAEGILDTGLYQTTKKVVKVSLKLNVKAIYTIAEAQEPLGEPLPEANNDESADDLPF